MSAAKVSPPGGVVATPSGGELHTGAAGVGTPIWDELADRWAELVERGALVPLVLPELDDELDEPGGG